MKAYILKNLSLFLFGILIGVMTMTSLDILESYATRKLILKEQEEKAPVIHVVHSDETKPCLTISDVSVVDWDFTEEQKYIYIASEIATNPKSEIAVRLDLIERYKNKFPRCFNGIEISDLENNIGWSKLENAFKCAILETQSK